MFEHHDLEMRAYSLSVRRQALGMPSDPLKDWLIAEISINSAYSPFQVLHDLAYEAVERRAFSKYEERQRCNISGDAKTDWARAELEIADELVGKTFVVDNENRGDSFHTFLEKQLSYRRTDDGEEFVCINGETIPDRSLQS